MSATYGTFRLIYEDASWFLGKPLAVHYAINRDLDYYRDIL